MNTYKLYILFIFLAVHPLFVYASNEHDSLNKKRLFIYAGSQTVLTTGMFFALNEAWYKDFEHSSFHVKDDMGVWNQVDKLGHAYSAYSIAGMMTEVYSSTGLNRQKSTLIGAGSSLLTLSMIELLDAYSAEWGFSYGDMLTNTAGVVLYGGQELLWQHQFLQLKFGFNFTQYPAGDLQERAHQVFGKSLPERLLKDYNAQTYWLSADVHALYKKWPKWLNVAVGYSAEDMYGAYYNTWKNEAGVYHDYSHINRYRQWLLSLDVNFASIETNSAFLNRVFNVLTIKVPAPTLEYNSRGQFKFHAMYF